MNQVMAGGPFLEAMNGALCLMGFCVVGIFGYYVVDTVIVQGLNRRTYWPLNAAIAIVVYNIGETILRGWIWYWRLRRQHGENVDWMTDHWILRAALVLCMIGLVCNIRVFAPGRFGDILWVVSLVVAVVLSVSVLVFGGGEAP